MKITQIKESSWYHRPLDPNKWYIYHYNDVEGFVIEGPFDSWDDAVETQEFYDEENNVFSSVATGDELKAKMSP